MSLIDLIRPPSGEDPPRPKVPEACPQDIDRRVRRGRADRDRDKAKRVLYWKFWKGDQYWFLTPRGTLNFQATGMTGTVAGGKPGYRVRNTYNFIQNIVEAKVSAATAQVPGYQVTPATDDPDIESAAELGEQILIYGYDEWHVRRHLTKAVTTALVAREAFLRPYFDRDRGNYIDGRAQGEVLIEHFTRDEVMWEPGDDFDDSRWHAIDQQRRVEDVKEMDGYIPGTLDAPRNPPSLAVAATNGQADLVTVTEYLERPCRAYPEGRRVFIAYGKVIVDYRLCADGMDRSEWWEPFPCVDANDVVCDEPALHRISYTVNPNPGPDGNDDFGLVERLIDLQRTINDTWNKIIEIKNRALLLQMWVPKGEAIPRRDDTPGATYSYNAATGGKPEWEPTPDPGLLNQLLQIHDAAVNEIREIAADVDIQPLPRLAEGTAQAAQQGSAARWGSFIGDLEQFHGRFGRHLLTLVARHYDEQRQVQIRGQYGWQSIRDFKGQDLRSQVNVRVTPGSLAAKSREAIQALVQFMQANYPGAIPPEAALAAIQSGNMTGLIRSYENDLNKAWRVVKRLRGGGAEAMLTFGARYDPTIPDLSPPQPLPNPQTGELMSPPPSIDPTTGMPLPPPMGVWVPGWMPSPADNIGVWRTVIGDYTKTLDFEQQPPDVQEHVWVIWRGLEASEQERAAKQAAQQQMQAESLGMSNAGKPQTPPPLPDRAGFTNENQSPVERAPQ